MVAADGAVVLFELDVQYRIGLEPSKKRFNSAYLQILYLISIKLHSNTFWLYKNFFLLIKSHHDVLEKRCFENKKNGVRFSIGDPHAKPAKQKKTSGPRKIIEVTHSQKSGRGRGSNEIIILLKLFFLKIPVLVHRRTLALVAAKNRR